MGFGFDEWQRRLTPVTCAEAERVARRDFRGRTLAVRGHLVGDAVAVYGAFAAAGARVVACPCNPASTQGPVVTALLDLGVEVHGGPAMTAAEDSAALEATAAAGTDILSDMGGDLIAAALRAGHRPRGALEATGSGITLLRDMGPLPVPVFNWDDIPLKEGLHNRFHVGATVWPAFEQVTAMNLFGRRVLVVGSGPVGRGVAERAKALGAVVTVVERDPVRRLEAAHLGLAATADLLEVLPQADIVATATGRAGVLGPAEFARLRDGAILLNCGHGNREIDLDQLSARPPRAVRPLIDAHDLGDRTVYVLNGGNLLNLAPGIAAFGVNLFDPFGALMILGLEWLLDGGAAGAAPGLHPFPAALERRIAELVTAAWGGRQIWL